MTQQPVIPTFPLNMARRNARSVSIRRPPKGSEGGRACQIVLTTLHKSLCTNLHSSHCTLHLLISAPSKPFKSLPSGLHFPSGPQCLPLDPAWIPQRLPFSMLLFLDHVWKCFLWSPSCEFHDFGLHLGSPKSSHNRSKVGTSLRSPVFLEFY